MAARKKQADLGTEIDKLNKLRATRQEKSKAFDEAKRVENEQQQKVIELLKAQRLDRASGHEITASITKSEVVQVEDWDKVNNFILRNKYTHLFHRRLSDPAVREVVEARKGKPIPGTKMVEIEKLSVTSK